MSHDGYERDFQSPDLGPPWMHGKWSNKMWAAVGRVLDAQTDLMRAARKASMPDGALALGMSDALDRKGDDVMLPRGATAPHLADETDASYAERLKHPFTTWGQHETNGGGAGSVLAILTQLKIAGFPVEPTAPDFWTTGAMFVNHIGSMYQMIDGQIPRVNSIGLCVNRQDLTGAVPSPVLPGFTLDARDQFYSHFCIIFLQDVPQLQDTDCPAKSRLNAICKRWKSASAIYNGAAILPSGEKAWGWPITDVWDQVDLWGSGTARFIRPE